MTASLLTPVQALLQRWHDPQAGDGELLRRFVEERDEIAFALLVRRHGPMVLGVCRRILGHTQDAEDAFQATFLVLSKQAAALQQPGRLANWLFGVAQRTALHARRQRRRAQPLCGTPSPSAEPLFELAQREALGIIDRELARLPDKYRAPLVLCALEGRSRDEAAEQLGWPVSLVKNRLEAGRSLLRRRLLRHGVGVSASATVLLDDTGLLAAPIPATMFTSVAAAAKAYVQRGIIASAVQAALVRRVLRGIAFSRWQPALWLGGLLLCWAVCLLPWPHGSSNSVQDSPTSAVPLPPPQQEKPQEKVDPRRPFLVRGQITDGQGKPMPGITVNVHTGIGTLLGHAHGVTDQEGKYEIRFGPGMLMQGQKYGVSLQVAVVLVKRDGYFEKDLCTQGDLLISGEPLPEDEVQKFLGNDKSSKMMLPNQPRTVDFVLLPAATLQGTLVDPQGKPLTGKPLELHGPASYPATSTRESGTTDAQGRFTITNIPWRRFGLTYEIRRDKRRFTATTDRTIDFTQAGEYQAEVVLDESQPEQMRLTLQKVTPPKE